MKPWSKLDPNLVTQGPSMETGPVEAGKGGTGGFWESCLGAGGVENVWDSAIILIARPEQNM